MNCEDCVHFPACDLDMFETKGTLDDYNECKNFKRSIQTKLR